MDRKAFLRIMQPAVDYWKPRAWNEDQAQLYFDAIGNWPEAQLESVIKRLIDVENFMPKIPQLRAAANDACGAKRGRSHKDFSRTQEFVERSFEARLEHRTYKPDDGFTSPIPFNHIVDKAIECYDRALENEDSKRVAMSRAYSVINIETIRAFSGAAA